MIRWKVRVPSVQISSGSRVSGTVVVASSGVVVVVGGGGADCTVLCLYPGGWHRQLPFPSLHLAIFCCIFLQILSGSYWMWNNSGDGGGGGGDGGAIWSLFCILLAGTGLGQLSSPSLPPSSQSTNWASLMPVWHSGLRLRAQGCGNIWSKLLYPLLKSSKT